MKRFETPEIRDYMDKVHQEYLRLKNEAEFFGPVSWDDMNGFWRDAHDKIREESSNNDEA